MAMQFFRAGVESQIGQGVPAIHYPALSLAKIASSRTNILSSLQPGLELHPLMPWCLCHSSNPS